jgi:hypothetical protein
MHPDAVSRRINMLGKSRTAKYPPDSSFLKKRSKKLLLFLARAGCQPRA